MISLIPTSQLQEPKGGELILLPPSTTLLIPTIQGRVVNPTLMQAIPTGIPKVITHILKKHSKLRQPILAKHQCIKGLSLKNLIVVKDHIVVNQYNQVNHLLIVKPYKLNQNKQYLILKIMMTSHIPLPPINLASR